jgi:hypothetical protein
MFTDRVGVQTSLGGQRWQRGPYMDADVGDGGRESLSLGKETILGRVRVLQSGCNSLDAESKHDLLEVGRDIE